MHVALLIEVWLTDQNSKPQEIEDKININLVIYLSIFATQFNQKIEYL